jgi:CBS domain containing-hemolysin-like protein
MRWSLWLYSGFIALLNGSGHLLLKLFGLDHAGHRHIHSPEEIALLIAESQDGELLESEESERLQRALKLGSRPVRQLMVPRTRIAAVDVATPVDEILRYVAGSPYTHLPVYRGTIDHIIGLLHTKELFLRHLENEDFTSVEQVLRPILMVPETLTAGRLLTMMRERHTHQAVVIDEFGGVAGLVTLEDMLAEVLGEVADELKEDKPWPERLPDGRIRLPGLMRLDQAETWLGLCWQGEAETLGGHVMDVLGHIPEEGEYLTIDGVEVVVECMDHHAIKSLLARPVLALEEARLG